MKNQITILLCLVTVLLLSRCSSDDEPQKSQFTPFILKSIDEVALDKIPADVIPGIHADLISKGRNEDAANFLKTYHAITGELLTTLTVDKVSSNKSLSSGRTKVGESLNIRASIQNTGWITYLNSSYMPSYSSTVVGTTGQNKYMEAFIITSSGGSTNISIRYAAHVAGIGWQSMVSSGQTAGTVGQHRQIEAIKIDAENGNPKIYCRYRAHVGSIGWMAWVDDNLIQVGGDWAGTVGGGRRLEAFQLELYLYN